MSGRRPPKTGSEGSRSSFGSILNLARSSSRSEISNASSGGAGGRKHKATPSEISNASSGGTILKHKSKTPSVSTVHDSSSDMNSTIRNYDTASEMNSIPSNYASASEMNSTPRNPPPKKSEKKLSGEVDISDLLMLEPSQPQTLVPSCEWCANPEKQPTFDASLKRWVRGSPAEEWNLLSSQDEELWDDLGNTLVYLPKMNGALPMHPSFRMHSRQILSFKSELFEEFFAASDPETLTSQSDRDYSEGSVRYTKIQGETTEFLLVSPSGKHQLSGQKLDRNHKFNLYLPLPDGSNFDPIQLTTYNATMRNVFANIFGVSSIVGRTLTDCLPRILTLLDEWVPTGRENHSGMFRWMSSLGIHDVRNDPGTACDVLAACEEMRWIEGWKEAFVHCVGMYCRLKHTYQFDLVKPAIRALLEDAHYNTLSRIGNAHEYLKDFNAVNMLTKTLNPDSLDCSRGLQKFLQEFYKNKYGSWPPEKPKDLESWATRDLISSLELDFVELYEYLVDDDIIWDDDVNPPVLVSCGANESFIADLAGLPYTAALRLFGEVLQVPNIPLPFCHIPRDSSLKKSCAEFHQTGEARIYITTSNWKHRPLLRDGSLLAAFLAYETKLDPAKINPQIARRGHWALIYGTLQVLGSVSVDTPGLEFKEDVQYPLCCRMEEHGQIYEPWIDSDVEVGPTNLHTDSYCWRFAAAIGHYRAPVQEGKGFPNGPRRHFRYSRFTDPTTNTVLTMARSSHLPAHRLSQQTQSSYPSNDGLSSRMKSMRISDPRSERARAAREASNRKASASRNTMSSDRSRVSSEGSGMGSRSDSRASSRQNQRASDMGRTDSRASSHRSHRGSGTEGSYLSRVNEEEESEGPPLEMFGPDEELDNLWRSLPRHVDRNIHPDRYPRAARRYKHKVPAPLPPPEPKQDRRVSYAKYYARGSDSESTASE